EYRRSNDKRIRSCLPNQFRIVLGGSVLENACEEGAKSRWGLQVIVRCYDRCGERHCRGQLLRVRELSLVSCPLPSSSCRFLCALARLLRHAYFLKTMVSITGARARGTKANEAPNMMRPTRIFRGALTTVTLICGCMRATNPTVKSRMKVATKTGSAIFQPMMKICFETSIKVSNHCFVAIEAPIGNTL